MNHDFRLITKGGWGYPAPAPFAFDLSKRALKKSAAAAGVILLGKAPGKNEDDTRPLVPAYRHQFIAAWVERGNAQTIVGNSYPALENTPSMFGGAAGLHFTNGKTENPHAFGLPITLGANESLGFRGFVYDIDGDGKEAKGHVWGVRIGDASGGVLFQIRDGNPEIARMSAAWTRALETQLRLLWALDAPTSAEEAQIETLKKQIYSDFESLSFERSTGRDKWRGELFFLTLIPEPLGALHLVLEGADTTKIEFPDVIKAGGGNLWGQGATVEIGATGGAWIFQPLGVRFGTAALEYGPFQVREGMNFEVIQYTTLAQSQRGADGNAIAKVLFKVENQPAAPGAANPPYKLKATFQTADRRYAAWLYGLSARLEGGDRTGLIETVVTFDSDDLGQPGIPATDSKPILETEVTWSEEGRREATITMRDVNGSLRKTVDDLVGRVAKIDLGGVSFMEGALIARGRLDDAKAFAASVPSGPRRLALDVSKASSVMELIVDEGWQILRETFCDPPFVMDGLRLGAAIRRFLRMAGFSLAEIAGVPENLGPIIPRALPGQDWANVADAGTDCERGIQDLLDRFGLGLRFYRTRGGVWTLENVSTAIVANFTSSAAQNDPNLVRGGTRHIILDGLAWERDHTGFHNFFRVIGGTDEAPIVREFFDKHSMTLAPGGAVHSRWVGRLMPYPTLRDSGLTGAGAVEYAIRSLRFRFGRIGRTATFESYAHWDLPPWSRLTCDGVSCEWIGGEARASEDSQQCRVREIA